MHVLEVIYIDIITTLFVFGLLAYKRFLHYIICKENVNTFSDRFLIFKAMEDY